MSDDQITAYHGSPHDFDQFDTSKIGTGEGAQAYGHGLYFAESEPVAKGYRDKLSSVSPKALEQYFKPGETITGYGGKDKVLDYDPQSRVVKVQGIDSRGKLEPHVRTHQTMPDLNEVNAAFKERGLDPHIPGHMYEVAIDAHPDHFLDWDKPFDNQSQHVQRALTTGRNAFSKQDLEDIQKMYGKYNGNFGAAFHEFLQSEYPSIKNQKMASNWLSKRGIHGIRYLDASSRGPTDQPTHNYVVFDHNRVSVKRKYAQGGEVEAYGDGGHIPVGDPRRDENLARHMEGNHPMVPHVLYHGTDITKAKGGTIDRENVDYKKMPHSRIVEHALGKISAPLPALDPHLMAAIAGRRS